MANWTKFQILSRKINAKISSNKVRSRWFHFLFCIGFNCWSFWWCSSSNCMYADYTSRSRNNINVACCCKKSTTRFTNTNTFLCYNIFIVSFFNIIICIRYYESWLCIVTKRSMYLGFNTWYLKNNLKKKYEKVYVSY